MALIHFMDGMDDYDEMLNSGLLDYAIELKNKGIVRHLGFSSHLPEVAKRFGNLCIL